MLGPSPMHIKYVSYMTDFAYDGPIFLVPLSLSYLSSPVYRPGHEFKADAYCHYTGNELAHPPISEPYQNRSSLMAIDFTHNPLSFYAQECQRNAQKWNLFDIPRGWILSWNKTCAAECSPYWWTLDAFRHFSDWIMMMERGNWWTMVCLD